MGEFTIADTKNYKKAIVNDRQKKYITIASAAKGAGILYSD